MKLRILFCAALACSFSNAASDIPHLQKKGTATQLIVDGKPFLALTGELANNSATSLECMKPVWPKLVEARLNSVLAGVSWAQIEPEEGKFDFSIVDGVIQGARAHNLRLVFLWFASWKNGLSSYPPAWVKRDFERFPRAQITGGEMPWPVLTISVMPPARITGNMSIELLSTLSDANRDADARAFAALMRHIKEVDSSDHTVIMIQVQNEVGMLGSYRDRSPLANKAFAGPVPKELMDYLLKNKQTLIPEFRKVWEAAGAKTSGTWEEIFGQSRATDEIFMAWNYARYLGRVAEAGKAEYPIPLFVNAALHRNTTIAEVAAKGRPAGAALRDFAIGGPMADMLDIWRAGAPGIDMLSPDAYSDRDFVAFCAKYNRSGNPLFIPESAGAAEGAARVLYVFGRHDAIGYSPMGIDRAGVADAELVSSYDLITQLSPLIAEHQGGKTMSAVLMRGPEDPPQKIQVGNYTLEVTFFHRAGAQPQGKTPPAAAIFIAAGPEEYFIAGSGVTVSFAPNTPGPPLAGIATVEEGTFVNGRWVPGRQLAGDDSDEGQYIILRSPGGCCAPPASTKSIQRVTLYRYR